MGSRYFRCQRADGKKPYFALLSCSQRTAPAFSGEIILNHKLFLYFTGFRAPAVVYD